MNKRNVAALAALVVDFLPPGDEFDRRNRAHAMAASLAARGVLVPSALSDGECHTIAPVEAGSDHTWDSPDDLRTVLDNIAQEESA